MFIAWLPGMSVAASTGVFGSAVDLMGRGGGPLICRMRYVACAGSRLSALWQLQESVAARAVSMRTAVASLSAFRGRPGRCLLVSYRTLARTGLLVFWAAVAPLGHARATEIVQSHKALRSSSEAAKTHAESSK